MNGKAYIDIKKLDDMSKTETFAYEEISEEWENFENEIISFVTRCRSLFDRSSS